MNSPAAPASAQEINRLHEEVVRTTAESRECLHAALVAAWQAGQLLRAEQQRVRRTMGATWGLWLDEQFEGSRRTALNYMRLAETVTDIGEFQGLSLRQVYLRLGIATEPKSRADSPRVEELPAHIRLANRLLATLSASLRHRRRNPQQAAMLQHDLRALYERLRQLFEADTPACFPDPTISAKHRP